MPMIMQGMLFFKVIKVTLQITLRFPREEEEEEEEQGQEQESQPQQEGGGGGFGQRGKGEWEESFGKFALK